MNTAALGGRPTQRSAASGNPHHQRQYSDQFLLDPASAGGSGSMWLQSQQVDYFRMLRSMQRGMSGDFMTTEAATPPLGSRSSSLRRDGDDVELSPGILDLHSFDSELLPEMPAHGAGEFGYARGRSFDDSDLGISANRITSKPQTVSENNLLKSFSVDKEKSGSVAKIKVVVRKRPLNKKEISKKEEDIITINQNSNSLTVHETKLKEYDRFTLEPGWLIPRISGICNSQFLPEWLILGIRRISNPGSEYLIRAIKENKWH